MRSYFLPSVRTLSMLALAALVSAPAGKPHIALTPASLSFLAKPGGQNPNPAQVQLRNSNGSTTILEWTAESSKPWLRATPLYGTTQTEIDLLTVTAVANQVEAWTTPTSQANAPPGRENFSMVWTGKEMIVWGGTVGFNGAITNGGGRYDPVTDSWPRTTSQVGAPSPRLAHSAVWTGSKMIIWGGRDNTYNGRYVGLFNDGFLYDPRTDTWSGPISTINAPSARVLHSAVWTGTEMIVWGGFSVTSQLGDGGRYNPTLDKWFPIETNGAPSARDGHFAAWTGTEMLIWGGENSAGRLNTGKRYHPGPNTWGSALSTVGAPTGRAGGASVWTGSEMIVWGGISNEEVISNIGGRYDPVSDTWQSTTLTDALSRRRSNHGVWVGGEMIVWGGYSELEGFMNSGKRYVPPISLTPGNYDANVTVTDPNASNSPQKVVVSFKVE